MVEKSSDTEIPILEQSSVLSDIIDKAQFETKIDSKSIIIKEWESFLDPKKPDLKDNLLLGTLNHKNHTYTGLLDHNLQRDLIGIHKYENGDIYLGTWKNNMRNGYGSYLHYKPLVKKQDTIEMYLGKWKDDKPEEEGVYAWITEPEGNKEFDNCTFEAFIGTLNENEFKRGVYLTKSGNNFIVYYGEFKNGAKHDTNCYFYENDGTLDRVFRGKIENDEVKEGFFVTFNHENTDDSIYLKFKNNKPTEVLSKNAIDQGVQKKVNDECLHLRETLYEDDWFGLTYNTVKTTYNKIRTFKMNDFNNEKQFNEIVEIAASYKKIIVYSHLCKSMSK